MRFWLGLLLAFGLGPVSAACVQTPDLEEAAATIIPEDFYSRIGVMAHDSMRGRTTPSREIDLVAAWAGREFERMGLLPGGDDGSFVQRYSVRGSQESAPNTVAVLEGSDPLLKDEYVVFSAHMDAVGVGEPIDGDSIRNGADDDASGSALVLEIAEAMASLSTPPRRSMIFLLVSGEERGLWGSRHFAENPFVPTEQLVANLNADMVGRNWTDTIVAIGREHSDLGETLERVNAAHPELHMTAVGDLWPEQNFYRRSDHFNFARKGVPILFFFNGTHEDYHQPSDEVDKIDTEKASRIGRLVFYLGYEIAMADERPQWDPESYREIVEGGG